MTNAELAELRAEIYGCKMLLFTCINFITEIEHERGGDLEKRINEIQREALDGILNAGRPPSIRNICNSFERLRSGS